MKLMAGILLVTFLFIDPGKIGRINTLKSEAKEAFQAKDFKTAITKYKYLVDSMGVNEEEVTMNLAHAYFQAQDTANALNTYLPLTQSYDAKIKSLANQQLGVLSNRQSKLEEALNYFKQALKAAPENEDARLNYEMVKKKLEDQKKQDQQKQNEDKNKDNKDEKDKQDKKEDQKDKKDQNKDQKEKDQKDQKDKKDQEKKDQEEKEKKDQEKKDQEKKKPGEEKKDSKNKEKKEIPPSVSDKLKEMQMSEEKAKMILEAMKHQEIQYLQQNKRKATKPKDRGKPDW